jgi:general secretion pathway protein G
MITRLKKRMQEDEGFTLIELLIVIVVLGILAAIVVFALSNQTSNSATAACKADAKSVEVAQEAFRAQQPATYAANLAALVPTYLRSAPSAAHYTIITDVSGAVGVYPPNTTGVTTVDATHNFDTTNGAVCSPAPTGFVG